MARKNEDRELPELEGVTDQNLRTAIEAGTVFLGGHLSSSRNVTPVIFSLSRYGRYRPENQEAAQMAQAMDQAAPRAGLSLFHDAMKAIVSKTTAGEVNVQYRLERTRGSLIPKVRRFYVISR